MVLGQDNSAGGSSLNGGFDNSDDWRVCVDFGTALSKAAIASSSGWRDSGGPIVRPLPLGRYAGNPDPLLVPSAVYIEKGRIYFGPTAINRARESEAEREPLQSFKMLLSARDLPAVLDSYVKRTIDPDGQLTNRAILTLYIGYLGALIDECFAADPVLAKIQGKIHWRYSRPDWPGAHAGVHDRATKSLFEHGLHASKVFKLDYIGPNGLDIVQALEVIRAEPPASNVIIEGGILEAHAATAAHATGGNIRSSIMMVVDIGAGTTDFDGFRIAQFPNGRAQMVEIGAARRSIPNAGDEVDRILMNAFIDKAGIAKNIKAQTALWRSMAGSIREIKRQAFLNEKCAVRFENKSIVLNKNQIEGGRDFKTFMSSVKDHFEESLTAVAAAAKAERVPHVSLFLAGGGAALPFVQEMARKAEKSWKKDARVILEPLAPAWVNKVEYGGGLNALFPQLEVAIGGTSPLIGADQLFTATA